jgi:hypothetical protein
MDVAVKEMLDEQVKNEIARPRSLERNPSPTSQRSLQTLTFTTDILLSLGQLQQRVQAPQ